MIRFNSLREISEDSPVRCLDPEAGEEMMKAIDTAKENGIPLEEL